MDGQVHWGGKLQGVRPAILVMFWKIEYVPGGATMAAMVLSHSFKKIKNLGLL
jgi:hypothetical protein